MGLPHWIQTHTISLYIGYVWTNKIREKARIEKSCVHWCDAFLRCKAGFLIMNIDIDYFKLDIDELIGEFTQDESTTLADMKRIWFSRKFSYIYEACPSTNLAFFMQSLYAQCIGYIVGTASLSQRLGGFYCLYCLYETQPFNPSFKVYLSLGITIFHLIKQLCLTIQLLDTFCIVMLTFVLTPYLYISEYVLHRRTSLICDSVAAIHNVPLSYNERELKKLRILVADAKANDIKVVPALVKRMLERNVFLFGSVDLIEGCVAETVNQLQQLQNARIQVAYEKLFESSSIDKYIQMDLGLEVDLSLLKNKSSGYAAAKSVAIQEASRVLDVENIKHIQEDKHLIGDVVEKVANDWHAQKQTFYKQTGLGEDDEYEKELEQLLLDQQPHNGDSNQD
ncbi:hypothetical protein ACSQ67_006832 [Phaseolus vulgaris]